MPDEQFEPDDPEPEHRGHYECPKCDRVEHSPGICPKCGVPLEPAD